MWEYVSPFVLESGFGPTPVIFRSHRYALDDPPISPAKLNSDRWSELTQRSQNGQLAMCEEA